MHHISDRPGNTRCKVNLVIGVVCVLVCGGVLLAGLWYSNSIVLPGITPYSIPDQRLQSTAVYLANNPQPLPESPRFTYTSPPPGETIRAWDRACVYLSVITFWERGEDSSELVTSLRQNTVITVDEVPIQALTMQLGILVEDPQKGLGPGPLEFCFAINLKPGAHLFQMVTQLPGSATYSYSWAWIIDGN